MERRAERNRGRRGLAAALLVIAPILLAGCEERPAYVLNPDYAISPYPVEHPALLREVALRVPRPIPRPDYVPARYEEPAPKPRPAWYDASYYRPAPKDTTAKDTATNDSTTGSRDQSWWSWWVKPNLDQDTSESAAKFVWPVQGPVISAFGGSKHGERNDGINIATEDGTPIRAAAAGTVTYTGNELKGYGNLVLIKHADGFITAYAHAGSIRVNRGDVVEKGQVIGTAGETGDVDRPQLHFEIRHGVQAVDPERYLDRAS